MVIILVAPTGAGKSTKAKEFAKNGVITVNDDAIVKLVHGGEYRLYEKKLKPLYKLVENQILTTALIMGRDVVIDRPNFSRNTRSRYISLAKSFDIPVKCILFPWTTPEETALMRYNKDNRGYSLEYWLDVAKVHYANYEEPSLNEGFVEIQKV